MIRFLSAKRLAMFAGVCVMGVSAACFSAATPAQTAKPTAPGANAPVPITVSVNVAQNRKPISPLIYGSAYADDAAIRDLRLPLNRLGGNSTTRYNWRENADNRGNDYFFQSIGDDSATPGERASSFITRSKASGAEPMITIPMVGYVAHLGESRSKLWSYSIKKYGQQQKQEQWNPDSGNGIKPDGKTLIEANPLDANVPTDESFQKPWVEFMVKQFGAATATGVRYYLLDNEPALWHSTHRDVHPVGAKLEEVRDKSVAMAKMIKSVDPAAQVLGPEEWGWTGFLYSGYDTQWGGTHGWLMLPDRMAHGNKDAMAWYLEEMKRAEQASGKRLLDVFTLHIYPQGGEFTDDVSEAMQLRRNRSTRALFDPSYKDETWINDTVRLIPRMKEWVAANYPGTKIGITEYNWGAEKHINGATAQADIYGIFGREGLDIGTRWTTPAASSPVYNVMRLFRNYNNKMSGFGETSVSATTTALYETLTTYASERKDGTITVLIVSKGIAEKPQTRQVSVNLSGKSFGKTAEVWRVGTANASTITHEPNVTVSASRISLSVPTPSVTLLVIPTSVAPKVK